MTLGLSAIQYDGSGVVTGNETCECCSSPDNQQTRNLKFLDYKP